MEKSCKKRAPKASPRLLFYFGKQPRTAIACKIFFLKQDIQKGDYQIPLEKLTLFLLLKTVPFNGSDQKQKGPGASDQLLFRLLEKFTTISLSVIYYLTKFDGVK